MTGTAELATIKPCPRASCTLDGGHDGICRDRWTKPLILAPGGKKPVAYFRATKFVDVVEDRYNLERWQMRMVAVGLAATPELLAIVGATDLDDKNTLNQLCEEALSQAKAHDKRDRGTLLHALTDLADSGQPLPPDTTDADRAAVAAYTKATAGIRWLHREVLTVIDQLRVAGTPDGIGEYDVPDPDGVIAARIFDLKSGNTAYGQLKMAGQLAIYSRAQLLDINTWERSPLPPVNQRWGVIIDMDAETATVELKWIDLTLGWEVVEEAARIRALRRRDRTALQPVVQPAEPDPIPGDAEGIGDYRPTQDEFDLYGLIALAGDVDSLTALWAEHQPIWTDAHTAAAAARKATLAASAA